MKKLYFLTVDQIVSAVIAIGLFFLISPFFNVIFNSILTSNLTPAGTTTTLSGGAIRSAESALKAWMLIGFVLSVLLAIVVHFLVIRPRIWRRFSPHSPSSTAFSIASFSVLPGILLITGYLVFGDGTSCAPTELTFAISAQQMAQGGGDNSGPGSCRGRVYFNGFGGLQGQSKMAHEGYARCGSYHCGTLKYGDGREKLTTCTVFAQCKSGKATATGFTW
jgi:hypothetical protein